MIDLMMFGIFTLILVVVSGIFIFVGITVKDELHENMDNLSHDSVNYTEIIDSTMGKVDEGYKVLYWGALLIIIGMIISIFVGAYFVPSHPIMFIPYIFIVIISIIIAVAISNSYFTMLDVSPELAEVFNGFLGANYILWYLPMWVTVIGFIGGIIMFIRYKSMEGSLNYV